MKTNYENNAHCTQSSKGVMIFQKICFCGGSKVLYCWDKVYNHWSGKNLLLEFVTFYIFLLDSLRYLESSAAVTQNIFKALNFISRCLWWHVMRWYCAEYCDKRLFTSKCFVHEMKKWDLAYKPFLSKFTYQDFQWLFRLAEQTSS